MSEKRNPTFMDAEIPAKLIGYTNPLGSCPAFVMPIFERKGIRVVQIAGPDEKIKDFGAYEERSLGPMTEVNAKQSVRLGDPALHGFLFDNENVEIAPREELSKKLTINKSRLARYQFLYVDVLEYLGKYEEIDKELTKIQKTFRQNPAISDYLVAFERKALKEKKATTPIDEPPLKFVDGEGYLNFLHLDEEVQHLIQMCGQAYIRIKLLRGYAGKSPKIRDMLKGLGLRSGKINSETDLIPVDGKSWLAMKAISSVSMISEIQTRGEREVSIKPLNPVAIRKRYFKKNIKKNVKGFHNRDYICTVRPQTSCFVSYSRGDEEFVQRLNSRLRNENINVWYAGEQAKGSRRFLDEILRAIESKNKLILVLSSNSMKRDWVTTEIIQARKVEREENQRKLFPIRLVKFDKFKEWDTESGKDLAVELREYYMPDFSNWEDPTAFEVEFAKLLRDLKHTEN
jgi:hypothetical protein